LGLTYAPLPSWSILLKSILFRHKIDEKKMALPWLKGWNDFFWLSRTAWSLYLIVKFRIKATGNKKVVVWCPDYFCNASLAPLRDLGVCLKFYQIREDHNPNIENCIELMKSDKPDLIIAIHYFGKPAQLDGLVDISFKTDAWLIEDAAHVALPIKKIGTYGDFVLYSPHKSLPIPDGALFIVRDHGPSKITKELQEKAGLYDLYRSLIKPKYSNRLRVMAWVVKRIIQKLGLYKISVRSSYNENPVIINSSNFIRPRMSFFSKNMLINMLSKIHGDFNEKAVNQKYLMKYISTKNVIANNIDMKCVKEYIPYLFTLSHSNKKNAEATFVELSGNRLPVSTWPDLPPEIINNSNAHKVAIALRDRRVYLPLHSKISDG